MTALENENEKENNTPNNLNEYSFKPNKFLGKSKYNKNSWTTGHGHNLVNSSNKTMNNNLLIDVKNNEENLFQNEFKSVKMLKFNVVNENYHSFQEAIYPVIALAQIFALMPVIGISSKNVNDLKFKYLTFKFLYSLIVFMAISGLIAITIIWMVVKHVEFGFTVSIIFYATNFAGSIYFYTLARKWPKLMLQWDNIEKEFPNFQTETERKSLSAKIKLITSVLMIFALVEHSLSISSGIYKAYKCVEYFNPIDRYYKLSYPQIFQFIDFSLPIGILVQVVHIYCTFTWNFMDLFIIVISVGLSTRLKQINDNMSIVKHQVVPEIFWEIHRNYYQNFCDLLVSVDKALAWLILLSFSSNLYSMCLQLLKIIKPTDNLLYAIYFWFSLLLLITRTFAVALYAANIYDESRKPIDVLQNVPKNCYNMEVKRFLQQIVNNKIALTGNKFFHITRQLILKIAGTVVTYELVLIQFNAGYNATLENVEKCVKI